MTREKAMRFMLRQSLKQIAEHAAPVLLMGLGDTPIPVAVDRFLHDLKLQDTGNVEVDKMATDVLRDEIMRLMRMSKSRFGTKDMLLQLMAYASHELEKAILQISPDFVERMENDMALTAAKQEELLTNIGTTMQAEFVMTDEERADFMVTFQDAVLGAAAQMREAMGK